MTPHADLTEALRDTPPAAAWVPDDLTFGARLALVRQRMGWGNVKLAAEQCGLPAQSWRTWERDGVSPRNIVTIAMTIAGRTNVDVDYLLKGPSRAMLEARAQLTGCYPAGQDPLEQRVVAKIAPAADGGDEMQHGDFRKRSRQRARSARPRRRTVAIGA